MTKRAQAYLMENPDESIRLEVKTVPEAVRRQGEWSGLKAGSRVLDAGCGPGLVTSLLYEMIQPGGFIVGLDYSEKRIAHAKAKYSHEQGMEFHLHDLREPLEDFGSFDFIWARFVLEYNKAESFRIVENLTESLKPSGSLCLLDLDYNCMSHFEMPRPMETVLFDIMRTLEERHNFDPYVGRKLYSFLYDLGFEDIQVSVEAHHLFYGAMRKEDLFNWLKKLEVISQAAPEIFRNYQGGRAGYFADFNEFFLNPRRFTYTPLMLCKGRKPVRRDD